jgi:DNA-binding LacI/PurR family transcriptional regulator
MSAARQARRVRQSDIAKLAGVSQTTVSLILSGNPAGVGLPEETRRRVLETADRLGYVPDPAARRLAAGRSFLIGLHTFTATFPVDLRSSYYPFLVGIEEEVAAKGYDLLFTGLAGSEAPVGRESALSRLQLADGGILIGRHPSVSEVGRLLDDGFPLVYIGRRDEFGDRLPYVGADYVRASSDLVRRLHTLGHRRILYVREPDEAVAGSDRERGIRAGLAAAGLPSGPDCVVRTDGSDLTGDRLLDWLASGITAVIVEGTDTLAAAKALQATAEAAGVRYPEDFSLAMTGEQVYPELNAPVITGFAVPRRAMGREAVRLLVSMLGHNEADDANRHQLLPCSFIEGDTSGPPPAPGEWRHTSTTPTEPSTREAKAGAVVSTRPHDERAPAPATLGIDADVLVVGGGLGGVAAAIAACRSGRRVVLTEETDWVGGQLTAQAVPPDEHPWIEQFGCTGLYREFRDGIRAYYRTWYPLAAAAAKWRALNPGAGWVSKLCHEPRVALAVLDGMLAPHRAAGRLTVLFEHRPSSVSVDGDHVRAVELSSLRSGERVTVTAPYVLDATEHGDLLPLADVEYVTGAESRDDHGEPHAAPVADSLNLQGFTCCFVLEHRAGEDHTIDRPERYEFWRSYQADFWPGPLLGLAAPDPRTLQPVERVLNPNPDGDPLEVVADQRQHQAVRELWTFRRILARKLHLPGSFDSDLTLVNWPMNDYWLGPLIEVDEATANRHLADAKQLSLSLLYWLQTEAPRPDGGTGFPGLRLRPDVVGTEDGLAKTPYIREGRRIRAITTVTELDVALAIVGPSGGTRYHDAIGIGSYRIDLHPSTGGEGYIDVGSVPFEIPLGALLPIRVRNLLPAAKNIGTTHITNGCYRLHPVEWNIGEVVGWLAAFCLDHGVEPHQVRAGEQLLAEFQQALDRAGVERHWPDVRGY